MAGGISFSYTSNIGANNARFGSLFFSGSNIDEIIIGGVDIILDNICFVPDDLLDCSITDITTLQACVGDTNDNGIEDYTITMDFEHELSISSSW